MNERIRLDFIDYNPTLADWMLGCARTFAVQYIDRAPGFRKGVIFTSGVRRCVTYWTAARMVVVSELENDTWTA